MRKKLRILKILEYHDIVPEKGNVDIKAILRKYNREKLIQIVNVLSLNYGNAFMPDTTFFSEISKDKIEELNDRFQKFAPILQHHRICYCTQRTIIVVMSIDTLFFYKDIFMRKGFVNVFDDFFRFNKKCGNTGVDWILDELADFNGYMRSTYKPCKSSLNYNKQMVADTTTKYKQ